MNLETPTIENLTYLVESIKSQLKVANASIIDVHDFRLEDYDEILEIFQLIDKRKGQLTMMEIDEILAEIGRLRQTK